MQRRKFIAKSLSAGIAGTFAPGMIGQALAVPTPKTVKDDISLAQWALVDEFKSGKLNTLDFPKVARQDFDINGIELVNTLFDSPTSNYLNDLKKNARDYQVELVLIMVDSEGSLYSKSEKERKQTVLNHRKWIDIANFLGCRSIRINCRGANDVEREDALKWSIDTVNFMLEYAIEANVGICVENHGGWSNDVGFMLDLMKGVENLYFGSYPDWRSPSEEFDNYEFLKQMLPYAKGMSYRNQPNEEIAAKMIKLCKDCGYRGWYGIETSSNDVSRRKAIQTGVDILRKYL